jgi:hypothetical protein
LLNTLARQSETYVLLNEVEATVHGHEGGDLLAVLDQLDTGALTNSGVGLLGLNATAKAEAREASMSSSCPTSC